MTMEKDKLIEFIAHNRPVKEDAELTDWINASVENREEFFRYKNLWALLQQGTRMPEATIQDALRRIWRRSAQRSAFTPWKPLLKYAAIMILAVGVGYLIGVNPFSSRMAMNEVFVPNGNRTSIVLPDGSTVWISNGSRLVYPERFTGPERVVTIEGEGYFNIAHDSKHPFIVQMDVHRIKVLGTRFVVSAYPGDPIISADLISGLIYFETPAPDGIGGFRTYKMNPSQSLAFNKSTGKITSSRMVDNFYDYWEKGVYQFRNESFEDLARKIERIYDVKIVFEDAAAKNRLFSGSLSIDDNIFTLMEVFKRAAKEPFDYTHDGKHIYIK